MKVRLKYDWLGSKAGAVLDLIPEAAKMLIDDGTATAYRQPSKKQTKAPPKNKMVRSATNKG